MAMTYNFTVKRLSELKNVIFSEDNIKLADRLENAILVDGFDLTTYFPPQYQDTNKKALFDDLIQNNKYKSSHEDILLTRFNPIPLPIIYKSEQHNDKSKTYIFIPNVFNYDSTDETNVIEWHMNFANHDIFAFYNGSLLAQDELQVLECPQLASLREYLVQQNNYNNKLFNPHVVENNKSYPILISNIERVIDLNTTNLYGHSFSSSSKATVLKSYKYLNPPQITNIIAIEAPKYGQGPYTSDQICYILQTCFTAYSAAKILANITYKLNNRQSANTSLKTHIHTGWFGCGAYGGNRTIMIILQILAAKMAGIDKLIFHTVTDNCQQEKDAADAYLENIFDSDQNQLSTDEVIEKIFTEKFQWGHSDGT